MRLLLSLLALCTLAGTGWAAEAKPTAAVRIAVLRLDETIRNSKFYLTRLEQLKKDQAEAQAALKKMEEQLQAYDNQLQVLSQGSDKFVQIQEELETTKVKRELLVKRTKGGLDRRHGVLLKETFDQLRGHLKEYCKEQGIMLVTLAPNPELVAPNSTDVQMQLGLQTSLYFDPSLDITEAFIAFANGRSASDAATGK